MKKRENKLKREFFESLNYIRDSKIYIYSIIIVFVLFALIAFCFPIPAEIQSQIMTMIQELLKETEGLNFWQMFSFIFLNNLKSSFFGMVSGMAFGIFSVIITIINGYFLGFVSMVSVNSEGFFVLWKLFPHGIFELPALFISLGIGLRLGVSLLKKNENLIELFKGSMKVFFIIVVPLLIIAGLIESSLIIFSS
jgi:stage II sporulation protein M